MRIVVPAKDGWAPSRNVIQRLEQNACSKGLISDWPVIAALENHDLFLDCSHVTGDNGADLIARKKNGKWIFMTDHEGLEP